MAETLFEELKRYVGFGPADEQALRALYPLAQPHFRRISEVFYQRILEHEGRIAARLTAKERAALLELLERLVSS